MWNIYKSLVRAHRTWTARKAALSHTTWENPTWHSALLPKAHPTLLSQFFLSSEILKTSF